MSQEAVLIEGSCHCRAVRWTFDGVPDSATACNCTLCRRYGVLWAYDFEGERIRVAGETRTYAPGESIGFHFCAACGCVTWWRALAAGPGWPPPHRGQPQARRTRHGGRDRGEAFHGLRKPPGPGRRRTARIGYVVLAEIVSPAPSWPGASPGHLLSSAVQWPRPARPGQTTRSWIPGTVARG